MKKLVNEIFYTIVMVLIFVQGISLGTDFAAWLYPASLPLAIGLGVIGGFCWVTAIKQSIEWFTDIIN